jgi:glycosyltransferase involved in cell wall biosynthesis
MTSNGRRARTPRATPRVSICVPNLNTRAFLPERFQTIFEQSFQDWELLVYDSYSTDGAWEYIAGMAAREPRVQAWQGPREGTPGSWTPCVRAARGEYVYIATSDDTMAPDCLEALVDALDAHPSCDLAHCRLHVIDENGREFEPLAQWWAAGSLFAQSSGTLLSCPHIRLAPYDGLLHLLGGTVYTSITQLLIRRSLFDRIGFFQSTWRSVGDFNWSMRAGLTANTVHVPDTWGGWRVHSSQATAGVRLESPEHIRVVDAMIEDAVAACHELLAPAVRRRLATRWMAEGRELRAFTHETSRRRHRSFPRRVARIAGQLCTGSSAAREYTVSRLLRRPDADWVRRCLDEIDVGPSLIPLPESRSSLSVSDSLASPSVEEI